jgi:hypothetical protein
MKASESIRKNRREWVYSGVDSSANEALHYKSRNAETLTASKATPERAGESCESVPESESADRQAEDSQGR